MNTFELTISFPKTHYFHRVNDGGQILLAPHSSHKTGSKKRVNRSIVNSFVKSRTIEERRMHEEQQRLARAKEYQDLLDKNGWTRAELARQLGVSRVWVTTVLKKAPEF